MIAFDLDGTLIDSREDLADAANALVLELGGVALTTDAVAAMVGEGAGVLVSRVLAAAHLPASSQALPRFLALYDERLLGHTGLYPGVTALLTASRSVGTVAVLTNKPLAPTERILSGLGVRHLIDHVVGGDGPEPRKPDPAGLSSLMRMSGADAWSTILVGDSNIDRETARRAGAACCLVTYGFGTALEVSGPREWTAGSADAAGVIVSRFARTGPVSVS